MNLEEAIKLLKQYQGYEAMFPDGEKLKHAFDLTDETVDTLLSALRPVSREQVEKVWRGCSWCNNEGKNPKNWECSLLDDYGFSIVVGDEVVWTNAEFCPVCGKPLTDEAVQMVMERLEAQQDDFA